MRDEGGSVGDLRTYPTMGFFFFLLLGHSGGVVVVIEPVFPPLLV